MTSTSRGCLGLLALGCIGLTACSEVDAPAAARSGDGVLDCGEGEVVRAAGVDVTGASEAIVVQVALAQWTDQGAALIALPPDESWSAVRDGRDVAIAYPERNGDGSWTVHAVDTCGEPESGPAPVDGELDCVTEISWSEQGLIDPTALGFPSPREAVRDALVPFKDRHGGSIETVDETRGSLVVDGREQVVAFASPIDNGGRIVATISGCAGFER